MENISLHDSQIIKRNWLVTNIYVTNQLRKKILEWLPFFCQNECDKLVFDMRYIADLHVHSHYSRATSKDLNLESLYQWAKIKGINVVGTGDFTHPEWFAELKEKLHPDGNGFFTLKNPPDDPAIPGIKTHDIDVRFCLTTEISSIYKHGDRVRKNHNLVYAPDFDTVARINHKLSTIGNPESDGRPGASFKRFA